ncbi:monooxygenase [Algimonas arctica]|uniref:Monooxygenase n=1 Tax=Algimonas arctica TaxID=1479486 RepID=A0A8J3G2G2_9PROT|nr:FAD-dependent monooxygenase [Algimonas arctica]GHA93946.1 monooxygenase [Algimonas arctica]
MKILIAGGGIGGLTAALACAHFGHEVLVFEQADALGDVGAGIQIPPNAMKVFRALGIAERIARDAVQPTAIETRMGLSGRTVFSVPLRDDRGEDLAANLWGAPYLHIHRADYILALKDALEDHPSITLKFGATVSAIDQTDLSVTLSLSDGTHYRGDLLIGADGLHSFVRTWMQGPDRPRFTGNIAWRAVVPVELLGADAPSATACAWMGPGRHAVTYQLRGGTLANFVGVVEQVEPIAEGWSARGRKADALNDFAGWHPTITKLIAAVPDDALFRWALYDRDPLSHWTQGRVTLLGDAAHPMLPFLAQGAAMAVEDAWVLAAEITESDDLAAALQIYQATRRPRTSRVQAGSRKNAKTFHKRTPLSQLATYGPMWLAGTVAPSLIRQHLSWLYGADVTRR